MPSRPPAAYCPVRSAPTSLIANAVLGEGQAAKPGALHRGSIGEYELNGASQPAAHLFGDQEIALPSKAGPVAEQPVDLGFGNPGGLRFCQREDESRWGKGAVTPECPVEV
jgi:hypothetical protein